MKHMLLSRLVYAVAIGGTFQLTAFGQAAPIKFGKIDPKDFDKAAFVADSAAEAVVLCDYGKSHFEYSPKGNYQIVFERVTRIKILKKSGYQWATVAVPLFHHKGSEERLSNLQGFTYNLGTRGEIVKDKLDPTAVFTEQVDTRNFSQRRFALPNVREGSVVEYAYTIYSDFVFNFQDWQFQQAIPVRWSEYRASIPDVFQYKQLWHGYEPLVIKEKKRRVGSTLSKEPTCPKAMPTAAPR
jgi:hypothetical protein